MVDSAESKHGQTDGRLIPTDWQIKTLAQLSTEIGDGIHATPKYVDSSKFHFINGNNLSNGSVQINKSTMCVSEDEYKKHKKTLGSQTILMSINGTIGNLAYFKDERVILGKSAAYINLDKSVCKEYIFYFLQTAYVNDFYENELTGTTIRNLSLVSLRNTPILLPPTKDEQIAISRVLSDIDELIDLLDKLIEKKMLIKQAAMQTLLTGKKRLPGKWIKEKAFQTTEIGIIPKDWSVENILVNSTLKARIGWQGLTTAEYKKSGIVYLVTGTDFEKGRIFWDNCFFVDTKRYAQDRNIQLKQGDILITKDGTIGKVAYVDKLPGMATLNSGIFVIRPKARAYMPAFLYYVLSSDYFVKFLSKLAAGSTINHLYQKDFSNFNFVVPDYSEQEQITQVLSSMDLEIGSLEQERDKCKLLKAGLMQQLLTGRIRLKWKS